MKASQFNKLVKGVKIFFALIEKIEASPSLVVKSYPNEYATALRAAAGAANCPTNQLSLAIFGRTLGGKNYVRNRLVGYIKSADIIDRQNVAVFYHDLVRLTFGEPEQTIGALWHDQTAELFN